MKVTNYDDHFPINRISLVSLSLSSIATFYGRCLIDEDSLVSPILDFPVKNHFAISSQQHLFFLNFPHIRCIFHYNFFARISALCTELTYEYFPSTYNKCLIVLGMTLNSIWWRGCSAEALENVKYPFITITPRFTCTQSGSICWGPIYRSNRNI